MRAPVALADPPGRRNAVEASVPLRFPRQSDGALHDGLRRLVTDLEAFTADCLVGFDDLELMDRGRRIAGGQRRQGRGLPGC